MTDNNLIIVSDYCCNCNVLMNCSSEFGHSHICLIGNQPVHGFCLNEETSGNGICKKCAKNNKSDDSKVNEDLIFDVTDLIETSRMMDDFRTLSTGSEIIDFVRTRLPVNRMSGGRSLTINRIRGVLVKLNVIPEHLNKPISNLKVAETAEFYKIVSDITDPLSVKMLKEAAMAPLALERLYFSEFEGKGKITR